MYRDLKNAIVTVKDGGGKSAVMKLGEDGTVEWTEGSEHEYKLDRGKLDGVVTGDEVPVSATFDFVWLSAVITAGDTVEGILFGTGAGVTSTADDLCEPYACDIEVVSTQDCGGSAPIVETILFPDFRADPQTYNMKEGKISCPGKCNVTTIPISVA